MILLITGDRAWTDRAFIQARLTPHLHVLDAVIEGEARGADQLARQCCEELGIPFDPRPADWTRYKLGAGPIRNAEMLALGPDACWAFHDRLESSKGTRDMVNRCIAERIPVTHYSHAQPWGVPYRVGLLRND